jgi:hypothetical protein
MSVKNSTDIIRNRNYDLLACSTVPQPTAPLCALRYYGSLHILTTGDRSSASLPPTHAHVYETQWLCYFRINQSTNIDCVLLSKPEGKRPLGKPRHRWEDNIKIDLKEVGGSYGDWMELAQDRDRWWALVGMVRNLRVPKMRGIS